MSRKFCGFWGRMYPLLISTAAGVIYGIARPNISHNSHFYSALDATLTFTSIVLGFITVLLTVVIGMKETSPMVKHFFEYIKQSYFTNTVKFSLFSGIVLSLLTIFMYFICSVPFGEPFFVILWIVVLIYFVLSIFRISTWLLKMMFFENNDSQKIRRLSENDLEELKNGNKYYPENTYTTNEISLHDKKSPK